MAKVHQRTDIKKLRAQLSLLKQYEEDLTTFKERTAAAGFPESILSSMSSKPVLEIMPSEIKETVLKAVIEWMSRYISAILREQSTEDLIDMAAGTMVCAVLGKDIRELISRIT